MEVLLQNQFVQIVCEEMARQNVTRAELARRMNVPRSMISRYLNGACSPGINVVEKFFLALDIVPSFQQPVHKASA